MLTHLLPSRRLSLTVAAPPPLVAQRLANAIAPYSTGLKLWRSPDKPFIGDAGEDGFEIRRHIRYRNSFLPIVTGQYAVTAEGTRITVTMQIHPIVLAFMGIWSSFWFIPVTMMLAATSGSERLLILFALLAPLLFLVIIHKVFNWEANQAEIFLRQTLLSHPVNR